MKSIIFLSATALLMSCGQQADSGENNSGTGTNTPATEQAKDVPVEMIENPATASDPNAQSSKFPVMSFKNTEHDFGDIIENQNVETTYKFTNTGNAPLLISECKATCGCTVPDWPKEPVMPGKSASIKVVFNSNGKAGVNNKIVTVKSNTKEGSMELKFRANVLPTKS
jgi:hypothetical protein